MAINFTPKLAKKLYVGDGGSYYAWSPAELPMFREGNIGAAKLTLEKNGFALPGYTDSAKIAYVLQGNGVAGIIPPEKEEKVIGIKKGDAITLPIGVITWWFNKEVTDLVILFTGDTSKSHKSGKFTDLFLTGFSTNLNQSSIKSMTKNKNQTRSGIVKLRDGSKIPDPKDLNSEEEASLVGEVGSAIGRRRCDVRLYGGDAMRDSVARLEVGGAIRRRRRRDVRFGGESDVRRERERRSGDRRS